jgi:hypothetical protein
LAGGVPGDRIFWKRGDVGDPESRVAKKKHHRLGTKLFVPSAAAIVFSASDQFTSYQDLAFLSAGVGNDLVWLDATNYGQLLRRIERIHFRRTQCPKNVTSVWRSTFHVTDPIFRDRRKSSSASTLIDSISVMPDRLQEEESERRLLAYFRYVPRSISPQYVPSGSITPLLARNRSTASESMRFAKVASDTVPD